MHTYPPVNPPYPERSSVIPALVFIGAVAFGLPLLGAADSLRGTWQTLFRVAGYAVLAVGFFAAMIMSAYDPLPYQ